MTYRPKVLWLL